MARGDRTPRVVRRTDSMVRTRPLRPAESDSTAHVDPRLAVSVIESKDLALARTPHELASQLEALTGGTEQSHGAATARHARRLNWVRENLFRGCCSFRSQ